MSTARKYDLIVYGATGYTGKLTLDYLRTTTTGQSLRWAIAGRSLPKLRALLKAGEETTIDCLEASVDNAASLDALVKQATVVMALAGPYTLCGYPVAAACVRNKTHYIDITGEFPYVRRLIADLHEQAAAAGVCLIPCCGFDSVPSDIIALVVHEFAESIGDRAASIRSFMRLNGGNTPSGGTVASATAIAGAIKREDLNPMSLVPVTARAGIQAPTRVGMWYDAGIASFTAPFIMAGCNERVVRRSTYLKGRTASYSECLMGTFVGCALTTLMYWIAGIVLMVPPLNALLRKALAPPGQGPSETSKVGNAYAMTADAVTVRGVAIRATFIDQRNAYDSTAVLVTEAAKTLIDRLSAPSDEDDGAVIKGGVLTPAAALGMPYVQRLQQCGVAICVGRMEQRKTK